MPFFELMADWIMDMTVALLLRFFAVTVIFVTLTGAAALLMSSVYHGFREVAPPDVAATASFLFTMPVRFGDAIVRALLGARTEHSTMATEQCCPHRHGCSRLLGTSITHERVNAPIALAKRHPSVLHPHRLSFVGCLEGTLQQDGPDVKIGLLQLSSDLTVPLRVPSTSPLYRDRRIGKHPRTILFVQSVALNAINDAVLLFDRDASYEIVSEDAHCSFDAVMQFAAQLDKLWTADTRGVRTIRATNAKKSAGRGRASVPDGQPGSLASPFPCDD
ncbi:hypothetical protein PSEUBRA_004948 [Kalmanozyma brasiliensis GHG001]|uniref:uncharacterized protein n=1 Tax=Kalmanozyma brasiliensis (strain GHG001) TaxID=1365824 RepID=UPI002867DC13|nr:uncharacterized protein PSEUBRA_004948 [Kalmanozyma brasiliensis GHG001]KAF6767460.1 hypothetical protein PSEUBRA_004948 [Kalmanozyma brasiliensis GHG001]